MVFSFLLILQPLNLHAVSAIDISSYSLVRCGSCGLLFAVNAEVCVVHCIVLRYIRSDNVL